MFLRWSRILRSAISGTEEQITSVFSMKLAGIGPKFWKSEMARMRSQLVMQEADTIHAAIEQAWKVQVLQSIIIILDWRQALQSDPTPWTRQRVDARITNDLRTIVAARVRLIQNHGSAE